MRIIAGVRYEMSRKGYNISTPYTFAKGVSSSLAFSIEEDTENFAGIYTTEVAIRQYTDGTLAPHILGSMGPIYENETEYYKELGYDLSDYVGKGGIEKLLESTLRGKNGTREVSLDYSGKVIGVSEKQAPECGYSVYLTLNQKIQN